MRRDGEAVTVWCRGPGAEWGAGLKKATGWEHFRGHLAAECSRQDGVHCQKDVGTRPDCWRTHELSRHQECQDHMSVDARSHLDTIMASPFKFTVGYALTPKKTRSFLQPRLEISARNKGIVFVAIDRNRPLDEQGPFDVILQKISTEGWHQQLKAYKQMHPDVVVLDPPESIKKVYNRQSMLEEVAALNLSNGQDKVRVPKQLVITGDPASIPEMVAKAGLKFPLVAKPLWVDGTAKSHEMSLAFNKNCLSDLDPPLVLQEFINHGGVLFKVYVVGDIVKVSRRFSLPDVCEGEYGQNGVIPFPRVSSASASAEGANLDPCLCELPPQQMLHSLCSVLRHKLGLCLFNLDMIREYGKGNRYYVIDINYFPGYGKMPDYEEVFTDFFVSLFEKKGK